MRHVLVVKISDQIGMVVYEKWVGCEYHNSDVFVSSADSEVHDVSICMLRNRFQRILAGWQFGDIFGTKM